MKIKASIVLALAVVTTTSLWLWLHHPAPAAKISVTPVVKPDRTTLPGPLPAGPSMTTVASQPAVVQTLPPTASSWSAIQKIADTGASYETRLQAVGSLSGHLTDADWAVLQPFLLKPDVLDQSQQGQVIKNQLLDLLCALDPLPAGLGEVLAKMYQDRQQNEVIRDYAVQHLTAYYEQLSTQNLTNRAETEQAIQTTLWAAINETQDSIGGTALLALKRLSQEFTNFDQGMIATAALKMAGDNSAGELAHITAYQVCAQLDKTDALPVLLEAARNGETIPVKMSAIGSLGLLGGKPQISFLNEVLNGTEDRLKPAAQHALDQINRPQNQVAIQK